MGPLWGGGAGRGALQVAHRSFARFCLRGEERCGLPRRSGRRCSAARLHGVDLLDGVLQPQLLQLEVSPRLQQLSHNSVGLGKISLEKEHAAALLWEAGARERRVSEDHRWCSQSGPRNPRGPHAAQVHFQLSKSSGGEASAWRRLRAGAEAVLKAPEVCKRQRRPGWRIVSPPSARRYKIVINGTRRASVLWFHSSHSSPDTHVALKWAQVAPRVSAVAAVPHMIFGCSLESHLP